MINFMPIKHASPMVELFLSFMEQGVLEKSGDGLMILIPSLQKWLVNNYGRERIEIPKASAQDGEGERRLDIMLRFQCFLEILHS